MEHRSLGTHGNPYCHHYLSLKCSICKGSHLATCIYSDIVREENVARNLKMRKVMGVGKACGGRGRTGAKWFISVQPRSR